eukprot:CAMPEP_0168369238 /NCGR_PEP_ID=MMETSP0228-20121227/6656_1 /TAXON_ID=133427 /ORGANISM="Protoceratium reticulatum, Strain CCCM 535 (=CCMP 1889)" /LENGTH=236 /DNA_ID=CAMNT_0008382095 /DNA_START=1 /DNA_END=712 /DNA_ORIENTATION=-
MEHWLQAIYFVLTVFTTIGFGDISAVTTGEMVYIIFAMVIGVVVNTIIMGKMINGKQKELMAGFAQHAQLGTRRAQELIAIVTDSRSVRQGFDREQVRKVLLDGTLPRVIIGQLPHDLFGGRLMQNRFLFTDIRVRTQLPPRLPLLLSVAVNQRYVCEKEVVYFKVCLLTSHSQTPQAALGAAAVHRQALPHLGAVWWKQGYQAGAVPLPALLPWELLRGGGAPAGVQAPPLLRAV